MRKVTKSKFYALPFAISILVLPLACFYFWIMNMVNLFHSDVPAKDFTAKEIIQVIGIPIAPIGIVMGVVTEIKD